MQLAHCKYSALLCCSATEGPDPFMPNASLLRRRRPLAGYIKQTIRQWMPVRISFVMSWSTHALIHTAARTSYMPDPAVKPLRLACTLVVNKCLALSRATYVENLKLWASRSLTW